MKYEDEKEVEDNKRQIVEAYNSNKKLHIKLKNGTWRNGVVKDIGSNFFIFTDDVNKEESFFYIALKEGGVSIYTKEEKEVKSNGGQITEQG